MASDPFSGAVESDDDHAYALSTSLRNSMEMLTVDPPIDSLAAFAGSEPLIAPAEDFQRKAPAPFITKLWEIVNRHPEVCGFGKSGDTVVIHDSKVKRRHQLMPCRWFIL